MKFHQMMSAAVAKVQTPTTKNVVTCSLCRRLVFVGKKGQMRRHKNRASQPCLGGEALPVQHAPPDMVQLALDVKGGAS